MIFVTVGSRGYPFNRLLEKLDQLCEAGVIQEPMFVQTGTSTYVPRHYEHQAYIPQEEFQARVEQADIVISHGASGSVMAALNAHKKVIVVSRLEKYGEHINDHQVGCCEAVAGERHALMADLELENLGECIRLLQTGEVELVPWENKDPLAIVRMIDEFIQENWR